MATGTNPAIPGQYNPYLPSFLPHGIPPYPPPSIPSYQQIPPVAIADVKPSGLKLHEDGPVVKKISGPVSLYYLKPPTDFYFKYKGQINMPLVLLFGDLHQSYDNLCEPCNHDDGCMEIYSPAFLTLLDNLSTLESPIDFYTESAKGWIQNHDFLKKQGILFNRFFKETTRLCHQTELRKKIGRAHV